MTGTLIVGAIWIAIASLGLGGALRKMDDTFAGVLSPVVTVLGGFLASRLVFQAFSV